METFSAPGFPFVGTGWFSSVGRRRRGRRWRSDRSDPGIGARVRHPPRRRGHRLLPGQGPGATGVLRWGSGARPV